jgi:hypothetical protein
LAGRQRVLIKVKERKSYSAAAPVSSTQAIRRIVFLSHANPEDNVFALWLGARLTAAGYHVWSDLLQLVGGERFWKDINEAIRQHTAVFLPILSNASIDPAKEGVHNEIAIATAVRRDLRLDNFIVPLRLERIPELPPQLIQLNYIDFTTNWADGLAQLLERLEKSALPKQRSPEIAAMQIWAARHASLSGSIIHEAETLQSNWFPIRNLPSHINLYNTPIAKDLWERTIKSLSIPCRAYLRLMISFAPLDTVQAATGPDIPVTLEYRIPTEDFLSGAPHDGPPIAARDARNIVTDLLRRGWESFANSRGLRHHPMAGAECWYVPPGLLEKDKAKFRDITGKAKWRAMGGVRGKKRIRWFYGVSIRPALAEPFRLVARSHVVFCEDGTSLVADGKRALRLRKWLCKSWWNDDFRDRLIGLIAVLSNNQATFQLPLGGDAIAVVDASPLAFVAPLTYVQHEPEKRTEADDAADDPDDEFIRRDELNASDADDDLIDDDDDDDDGDDGLGVP